MKPKLFYLVALLNLLLLGACGEKPNTRVSSPDDRIKVALSVDKTGVPYYEVVYDNDTIVHNSRLGLQLKEIDYASKLQINVVQHVNKKETWTPVWGQFDTIQSDCNEMSVELKTPQKDKLVIIFRVFNDGVGFCYRIPGNTSTDILNEYTAFNVNPENHAYWSGSDWENDEHIFIQSKLREATPALRDSSVAGTYGNFTPCAVGFNTPLTMVTPQNSYVSIHEAALWDYPGMSLCMDPKTAELTVSLASKNEAKASVLLPFTTPWRVIMLGKNAGELLTSSLILNLNEPNKLKDTSYITPMKYVGIWWEMHVKLADWSMESGRHGATTENVMKYIDFAAANGIKGVLAEGWNVGWDGWKNFRFTEPYPDFDMAKIAAYAKEKGVSLIGHHETGADIANYISQMDSAFAFYKSYGVHAVKTGYVGLMDENYHNDQFMVNHFNSTFVKGADYQIMVNIHEPVHLTGISRTYPNLMSGEGMRGQEFNAWSAGNDVTHNVILPFTRNLAGPMDFTPGIFDVWLLNTINKPYKTLSDAQKADYQWLHRVRSTLAHQLALYVVFYSPLQMVADIPENYVNQPAFQFIRDVAVDWSDTRVLEAEIAEKVIIARKEKGSERWFVGGIAGKEGVTTTLQLDFLNDGMTYEAIVYADAEGSDWTQNPTDYVISTHSVQKGSVLDVKMGAGGGVAISIKPVN